MTTVTNHKKMDFVFSILFAYYVFVVLLIVKLKSIREGVRTFIDVSIYFPNFCNWVAPLRFCTSAHKRFNAIQKSCVLGCSNVSLTVEALLTDTFVS